jgi:hypothetical protein
MFTGQRQVLLLAATQYPLWAESDFTFPCFSLVAFFALYGSQWWWE